MHLVLRVNCAYLRPSSHVSRACSNAPVGWHTGTGWTPGNHGQPGGVMQVRNLWDVAIFTIWINLIKFLITISGFYRTIKRVVSLYCCKISTTCIQRDHLTLDRSKPPVLFVGKFYRENIMHPDNQILFVNTIKCGICSGNMKAIYFPATP